MSAGTFKDDGSLDESEDYIQTTLTLKLTAEAKIGGSVGFDCKNTEKTWGISDSNTGINGFVGFSLAGEVGAKAQIWEIKFAASAAFKTVSEDGKGRSGIKIDYKPAMIAGERKWYGAAEFTGLAIEWALFVKVGREGEQALAKERKQISSSGGGFGGAQTKESDKPQASSAEVKIEKKSKKPAILFNKRSLYDGKSAVSTSI